MSRSRWNIAARLMKLVKPLAGWMAVSVTAGTLGHLCATFIMIFAAWAVLDGLGRSVPFSAGFLYAWMILFAAIRAVLKYTEQGCNHYIAFRLLALIRDHVFKALRRLSPAKLEARNKGDLISLITSDIELLEVFYAHTISPVCIALIYTIIMFVFIASIHPLLGLLALFSWAAAGIALPVLTSHFAADTGERVRKSSAQLSTAVLDSLRGLSETIRYDDGERRMAYMEEKTDLLLEAQEEEKYIAGRNMATASLLISIFDVMMIICGIALYQRGAVKFDGVLVSSIAMMSSFGPVTALAALGSTLQNTFAAAGRVLDILDEEPVTEDITGKEPAVCGEINAEDVSFSYEEEEILRNLSMRIQEHRITGITGRSGSGKSTFLKLLMRFWQPQKGTIEIAGRNINTINTSELRNMESYLTQDTFLFSDSIRNNLKIAKPDATDEEIETACRKASVHEWIMSLPLGYDTPAGELGDRLSEGEKQRIGLARAFLHDAPVILLDEPASNLDSLNEGIILKSLREEAAGKTVVLISHRPSSIRIADDTFTVENGRLS